ncbi:hypothetical protein SAY86_004982 [Trapa natans]|uniref:Uncharacterized protein n=1 Tax=Trapa natans TaxID=22666 RepID=A0AAN7L2M6_TRANT|nr:hypothetical protein SAY86_004982 [Trapa natans]
MIFNQFPLFLKLSYYYTCGSDEMITGSVLIHMMKKMRFWGMLLALLLFMGCIKDPLVGARRQGKQADIMKSIKDEHKALEYARILGNPRRQAESLKRIGPPRTRTPTTAIGDGQLFSSPHSEEEKKLQDQLQAGEEEILNLLHRDYSKGPPKAKRKPPINNGEPFN